MIGNATTALVQEEAEWIWADDEFCPPGHRGLDCYFEPLSNCSDYARHRLCVRARVCVRNHVVLSWVQ